MMAAALIDRCRIENIRCNSYRMRRPAELCKAIYSVANRLNAQPLGSQIPKQPSSIDGDTDLDPKAPPRNEQG